MTRSHGPLTLLGIAGSLRRGSYNRRLIRAAVELAPEGTTVVPSPLAKSPDPNKVRVPEPSRRC